MGENFSVLLNFWGRILSGTSFFAQTRAWENWFPREMTSEKNSKQKTRQQPDPTGCGKFPTRQEQSEALPRSRHWHSSVWNFCARFSDIISRGNQWSRNVGCFLRLHRGELETRVKIDGLVRGGRIHVPVAFYSCITKVASRKVNTRMFLSSRLSSASV